jgi:hypothetical protein
MKAEPGSKPASGDGASVYALLADGATIEIRVATPGDLIMVRAMHEAMSPDHAYLRFFSLSKLSAEQEAARVCRAPAPDHEAPAVLRGSGAQAAGHPRPADRGLRPAAVAGSCT